MRVWQSFRPAWAALVGVLVASVACDVGAPSDPTMYDEEQVQVDAGGLRDEEIRGRTKGNGGINGETDYCNDALYPCIIGEGDCDNDDQCAGPLVCGSNNGLNFGFDASMDVCWREHCENGVLDGDETGIDYGGSCSVVDYCPPPDGTNGDESGYCTSQCPCPAGFGDCDNDTQCEAGLVCGLNNGSKWGMPRLHDVCVIPSCANGVKDGPAESGRDYGGECGTYEQCLLDMFFVDVDLDTYGSNGSVVIDCVGTVVAGSVDNNRDCDDADPARNPDSIEVCNTEDDDCDGLVDEDTVIGALDVWADDDGDGFGDATTPGIGCATPPGYVLDDTDCDDTRDAVNPDATEVCGNGLDDDCDGSNPTCTPGGGFTSANAWGVYTGATDESIGQSIAAGDVDGDGARDLVLGGPVIPWRSTPAVAGSVYVLYSPLPAGTVDLPTGADARFTGEANQDHAGQGLGVGDINDDGAAEIFIGAPNNGNATVGGRVYMIAGGARASGTTGLASADAIWEGPAASRWFGYSVAAGYNFSGSATYGDFAAGAPGNFDTGTVGNTGNAYGVKGASALPSGLIGNISTASGVVKMNGVTADSGFGASVVAVGNVGGTSTPDLAVGAPGNHWWPSTPPAYDGDVHVFFGPISGTLTASAASVTISGADTNDWVGVTVGLSGDLDGDGVNELIVGASGDSDIAENAGRVSVFRGPLATGGFTVADAEIEVLGDTEYTYVGESASIGDFDGDGNGDLTVGSYSQAGYLWYGPIGDGSYGLIDADVEITSVDPGSVNFGWPTVLVGDLDGDGADELIVGDVGKSSSKGAVYLFSATSL
jgi:hypothetical protein